MFLDAAPDEKTRARLLTLATETDRLAIDGRELHWLPAAGILASTLDFAALEKLVGPTTTRTRNTVERLAAKFLG